MLKTLFAKTLLQQTNDGARDNGADRTNRRSEQRHDIKLYNGTIKADGLSHEFRLRNLSCTGVSGLTPAPVEEGRPVQIELVKDILLPATVRWTRGTSVGVSFGQPLPMFIVSAILMADGRHCNAASIRGLDLGPLASEELRLGSFPSGALGEADEEPGLSLSSEAVADLPWTSEGSHDEFESARAQVEDGSNARWEGVERRAAPRIRTLLRIAKITSRDDSGLCCLRSISDSGLMAETDLLLKPGEQVEFELSDRHRLCGRVVWRDEAGIGVALDEAIDSVSLLGQLAQDGTQPRARPPRLSIAKRAVAYSEAGIHKLSVVDISQKGVRVTHSGDLTRGLAIKICLENGFEERAIVRWSSEGSAGLEFRNMIPYQVLKSVSDF